MNGIPQNIKNNLVVVLSSDHGEYAGSHGLIGKGKKDFSEILII